MRSPGPPGEMNNKEVSKNPLLLLRTRGLYAQVRRGYGDHNDADREDTCGSGQQLERSRPAARGKRREFAPFRRGRSLFE